MTIFALPFRQKGIGNAMQILMKILERWDENTGEMAEWSNAAVLKTVDLHGSGGSNPSLSAERMLMHPLFFVPAAAGTAARP